jgi:hypothetical protein
VQRQAWKVVVEIRDESDGFMSRENLVDQGRATTTSPNHKVQIQLLTPDHIDDAISEAGFRDVAHEAESASPFISE